MPGVSQPIVPYGVGPEGAGFDRETGPTLASTDRGRGMAGRLLRRIGWAMIALGVLLLAFLAYQLFATNLITNRAQTEARVLLDQRLDESRATGLSGNAPPQADDPLSQPIPSEPTVSGGLEVATEPRPVLYTEPGVQEGEPLGRILIPRIGLDYVLMEGVERQTLKVGPGHMPWTPVPGQPGNAVVSGHRTTYGAPFFDVDLLEPGDTIEVETATGRHVYAVRESIIVAPTDVWVTDPRPGAWLTLTTCTPRFSARQRLIIIAELVEGPNLAYVASLEIARDIEGVS